MNHNAQYSKYVTEKQFRGILKIKQLGIKQGIVTPDEKKSHTQEESERK